LVSLAKGSTALVGLATALKSLGGVGGLFTMDLGLIFGAGTAMEIGLTIGAGLIAGIIAAWAGFDFGKWLGEKLFPEDAQWYKEFKWFGEGGFFKELENAGWANALIALNNMATDLASVILPDEVASEIQMGFEKAVRLLENYDWSNLINDIKENFWLVAFDTSLMQPNPIELVVDFFNQISEKSKVFAEGIKKMFELLIGGIHDLISKTKFDFNIGGLNSFGNIGTGIKAYATGGFPKEDGLFYANHTELVGKFSNGKTAVANNQQITDGIEEAAYRGMMRAFSNQGNYSNVNVTLEGDAGRLFRVVRKEADSFSRTTGRPAFS